MSACKLHLFSTIILIPTQRLDIDIHPKYKPRHIKALITLSKQSGLVPDCLILNGVEVEGHAVAAGGFGDVYKGRLKTQEIALKVLKVYQKSDMQKLLKVTFGPGFLIGFS